jgi:hypothetical protein
MQAMAQNADATANAGASAGATAIGSGGIAGASAETGSSSAVLLLEQNSTNNGSRIPVQPAAIVGGPVIQNFGPVGEAWNIGVKSISLLCSVKSEWTAEEAKALYNRDVDSASRAVFCYPVASKVRVFFHNNDTVIADMLIVGTISVKGDEKANSFDAFSRAIRDTAKMGGTVLLITRIGGQCRVETSGWGIGIGGLQSTTSSGDGRLGAAGYGGTGYSQAGSMYVGMPFLEGIALRGKVDTEAATETKPSVAAKQPEGIWIDDSGMPRFPWEKAYGAGVINGGR